MSNNNPTTDEATAIDEELVAYLDGELDADTEARIVRSLADDPRYNQRLIQLRQTWDLLDTLRRTEGDDDFVHSTAKMAAVQATGEATPQAMRAVRRRTVAWLGAVARALRRGTPAC